jgi:hypothetical protein
MKLGDWQRIGEIFQEALQHDPEQLGAFVHQACRGDIELQREVSSLLAEHDQASDFDPWAARAVARLVDSTGSLPFLNAREVRFVPGVILANRFRIVALIGKGGMGQVYRARDPRTGREVAIKFSAERFTDRFEREVRAGVPRRCASPHNDSYSATIEA